MEEIWEVKYIYNWSPKRRKRTGRKNVFKEINTKYSPNSIKAEMHRSKNLWTLSTRKMKKPSYIINKLLKNSDKEKKLQKSERKVVGTV